MKKISYQIVSTLCVHYCTLKLKLYSHLTLLKDERPVTNISSLSSINDWVNSTVNMSTSLSNSQSEVNQVSYYFKTFNHNKKELVDYPMGCTSYLFVGLNLITEIVNVAIDFIFAIVINVL